MISLNRWQKQNSKYVSMYEKRFNDFYINNNLFIKNDDFEVPRIQNRGERFQNDSTQQNKTYAPQNHAPPRMENSYKNQQNESDLTYISQGEHFNM